MTLPTITSTFGLEQAYGQLRALVHPSAGHQACLNRRLPDTKVADATCWVFSVCQVPHIKAESSEHPGRVLDQDRNMVSPFNEGAVSPRTSRGGLCSGYPENRFPAGILQPSAGTRELEGHPAARQQHARTIPNCVPESTHSVESNHRGNEISESQREVKVLGRAKIRTIVSCLP